MLSARLRTVFALYQVDRRICTYAAIYIRQHCQCGTARPIEITLLSQTMSKTPKNIHPHDMLDKAISVLRHADGNEGVVVDWAHGGRRGRPGGEVHRFLSRVPDQAWIEIAPIAAAEFRYKKLKKCTKHVFLLAMPSNAGILIIKRTGE